MSIDQQLVAPGDVERVAYAVEHLRLAQRGRNDVTPGDELKGLRVLDLAARTGQFSIALARKGAKVTAVEGRAENLAMAPKHRSIKYVQADVRQVAEHVVGRFDEALCLGLLYHLEPAEALGLLRDLRGLVRQGGGVLIDTHVSRRTQSVEVEGQTYTGHWYTEWPGQWSSIENPRSWWFTPDSLTRLAAAAGWETVEVLDGVRWPGEPAGRMWLVLS